MFPLVGLTNIEGDSDFIVYRDIVEKAYENRRKMFFYMILPDSLRLKCPYLPRCEYIFVPMSSDFVDEMYRSPNELIKYFSRREGTFLVDAIFTTRIGGSLVLQNQISDFRRDEPVPVVAIESMVRYFKRTNYINNVLKAAGYCNVHTWFLSSEERLRALEIVRPYMSYSQIDRFLSNSFIQPTGVNIEVLDDYIKRYPKNDKFQLFWGARFAENKRPDFMLELMEKFFSYGRDVDIVLTTQHAEDSKNIIKFMKGKSSSVKKLIANCGRHDFFSNAASSKMFLCTSLDESYPAGFFELLYIIQLGIFPKVDWAMSTLPPNYPFVYSSKIEAHAMMRYIYENYDEALKKVSWVRDWLRENANWAKTCSVVLDKIESVKSDYMKLAKGTEDSISEICINEANKMRDTFSFNDYLLRIRKLFTGFNPQAKARLSFPTRYEIYRTLLDNGWEDTFETSSPILRRIAS